MTDSWLHSIAGRESDEEWAARQLAEQDSDLPEAGQGRTEAERRYLIEDYKRMRVWPA